ncbi:hydroxylamine reductase [Thioflexithrix psekupsensis]|uniref:Hydroxylamine reductase n=1 Tax=Thioflexithrix psekupsensis TaxID=1570016 RepID=A0A251X3U0_9GAMM|nr:hydroxylamine reductase [Thioflexithrix psekupsensis]OUD12121.1 hydroxylamine reductase [Thioflexithrix psekupsensis]
MFCYQCEQTKRNHTADGIFMGCADTKGSCGKDATTADLQDLLVYLIQGIAYYQYQFAPTQGIDKKAAEFILYGLFTTLTNVNFNATRFSSLIQNAKELRDQLAEKSGGVKPSDAPNTPLTLVPQSDVEGLLAQAKIARVNAQQDTVGADVIGLRTLILYGLKGVAAYAYHAFMLGYQKDEIHLEMARLLSELMSESVDLNGLLKEALAVGELNLQVMALLEQANTEQFGTQQVTPVRTTPVAGKAILMSGHDLHDLKLLLEQTQGKNINVYTHGEMLPAHAYPQLKAYPHLVGNYGSAWQNQQQEFAAFPGPIVMTSNCIIEPQASYRQRLFTSGPVGWAGIRHVADGDFSAAIQIAQAMPGFKTSEVEKTITVGFGKHTVLGVADAVINAVQQGAIKHFFLIGGCDGAVPGRNYYTELAEKTPHDTVILTLGCGKYRFNQLDFGSIGGIPRLLDVGQCNDAYAAIEIAKALAGAFHCGVNDLPLSFMVSWFEQKATAVLLSLLALNVQNIHLGPSLPAYLTPNLIAILQEKFSLKANGNAEDDLAMALSPKAA